MKDINPCAENELHGRLVNKVWPTYGELKYDFKIAASNLRIDFLYSYAHNATSWCINPQTLFHQNSSSIESIYSRFDIIHGELKAFSKADFSKHQASIISFPDDHSHIKHNTVENTPYLYVSGVAGLTVVGLFYTALASVFAESYKIASLSALLTPASIYVLLHAQEHFSHTSRKCFNQLNYHTSSHEAEFAIEIDEKISVLKLHVYGDCINENNPQLSNQFAVSSDGHLYNFCDKEHETWLTCMGSTQDQL